jgi:hypothetical protein
MDVVGCAAGDMSVRNHLGDTRSRLPVKCRDCLDVGHTCHIRASWEVVQTDGECWSAEPLPLPLTAAGTRP